MFFFCVKLFFKIIYFLCSIFLGIMKNNEIMKYFARYGKYMRADNGKLLCDFHRPYIWNNQWAIFHFIGVQGNGRKIPGGRINCFSRANKSKKTTKCLHVRKFRNVNKILRTYESNVFGHVMNICAESLFLVEHVVVRGHGMGLFLWRVKKTFPR